MFFGVLYGLILIVQAQAPAAQIDTIKAMALYQQCSSRQDRDHAALPAINALKDKDPQKRLNAASRLAGICDSRAVGPLIGMLKDEAAMVRIAAVEALGQLGDQESIEPLIEALSDSDWRVRASLARTLGSFQVYQSNNAVLNVLVNPGEKKVSEEGDLRARCLGILVVNQFRDVRFSRKAIGFLFQFLDHDNEGFRRIAQATAAELKNTRNGYHELIGILKQHNFPDFRRKAAYWLGTFNMEEARAALEEAATGDRDLGVRKVAAEALASMGRNRQD